MTLPNFIVIGAEKSGTTSLHYYLQQHPDIYMSEIKETRYFCPEFYTQHSNGARLGNRTQPMSFEAYQELFAEVKNESAIGEASPQYIYFERSAERIKNKIPDAKIVAILRNPIERAFSAYCYQLRGGYETLSFEEALSTEKQRQQACWRPVWFYKDLGLYYTQLRQYFEIFDRSQVRICLYDDLKRDSVAFMSDLYSFLDVDPSFEPETSLKNVSGIPRHRLLHNVTNRDSSLSTALKRVVPEALKGNISRWINTYNLKQKPELSNDIKQRLQSFYREDILQLQDLIQKDLTTWTS